MKKKRADLAAINDDLNRLEWDPPLKRRVAVKHRNRWDVKFFFPDGASIRWTSRPETSVPPMEMAARLREIADVISNSV